MATIVMTNKEYVDTLKHIAGIPTVYINKFPYNCGYYNGNSGKFSFDCWNLVKAVINGWTDTRVHGYYVKGFKVTGDINGAQILSKCTKKSKDFTKLNIAGSYLYMSTSPHAGTYIGDTLVNGKWVNVVECTGAWTKNVLYSWVDTDGTRRRYKGGAKNGKWTDWGLMCWIDYKTVPDPSPVPEGFIFGQYIYKGVDYGYVFNPTYYSKKYKDLKDAFGTDDKKLFEHFCKFGMTEGRQAISNFNLDKYKAKNPDVVNAYGNDTKANPKYYEHYCRFGYNEGRKAT